MKQAIGVMLTAVTVAAASGNEINQAIKAPSNPTELLDNLTLAIKRELLLRDDFYSDENLKRFFSASKLSRLGNRRSDNAVSVTELEDVFENSRRYPGSGASIFRKRLDESKKESDTGKLRAHLTISTLHDSRLTADTIVAAFGAAPDISNPYAGASFHHPTPLQRKTHRLGNLLLKYDFNSPTAMTFIAFITNGDGTINRINLIQAER